MKENTPINKEYPSWFPREPRGLSPAEERFPEDEGIVSPLKYKEHLYDPTSIPTALTNLETIRFLAEQETRRQLSQIQGDPRPQQLQQVADLHKNHLERTPKVTPTESNSWLQTKWEKWAKRLKK